MVTRTPIVREQRESVHSRVPTHRQCRCAHCFPRTFQNNQTVPGSRDQDPPSPAPAQTVPARAPGDRPIGVTASTSGTRSVPARASARRRARAFERPNLGSNESRARGSASSPFGRTRGSCRRPWRPGDGVITPAWARFLAATLDANSRSGEPPKNLAKVFPKAVHEKLMKHVGALLQAEPTLLRLRPPREAEVVVVGDTHGQLHDALKLMSIAGEPSETNWYVFNGDFVDRGSWGAELFAVALAWKAAAPRNVFLLRGNHECEFCTEVYGYKRELQVKYSKASGNALWRQSMAWARSCRSPRDRQKTLVLHGGLFRGKKRRGRGVLRERCRGDAGRAGGRLKGGGDPDGENAATGDVLWSDPAPADQSPASCPTRTAGSGRCSARTPRRFLKTNGLSLVLRSHEGPDAREDREGMDNMHVVSPWTTTSRTWESCARCSARRTTRSSRGGRHRAQQPLRSCGCAGQIGGRSPSRRRSPPRARGRVRALLRRHRRRIGRGGPDDARARDARGRVRGRGRPRETAALEEEAGPEAPAAAERWRLRTTGADAVFAGGHGGDPVVAAVAAALTARSGRRPDRVRAVCPVEPAQVVHAGQTPRDDLRALGVRAAPGDELTLGFSERAATARDGDSPRVGAVLRAASYRKIFYSFIVNVGIRYSFSRRSRLRNARRTSRTPQRQGERIALVHEPRLRQTRAASRTTSPWQVCAAGAAAAPPSPAVAGGAQARHGAVPDGGPRRSASPVRSAAPRAAPRAARSARRRPRRSTAPSRAARRHHDAFDERPSDAAAATRAGVRLIIFQLGCRHGRAMVTGVKNGEVKQLGILEPHRVAVSEIAAGGGEELA